MHDLAITAPSFMIGLMPPGSPHVSRTEKTQEEAPKRKKIFLKQKLIDLAHAAGPGAKLPPMREIAESLGTTVVTLDRAIRELNREGIFDRRHGVGIFVSEEFLSANIAIVFDKDIFGIGASPFVSVLLETARRRAQSHRERFKVYMDLNRTGASNVGGHQELMEALSNRLVQGVIFIGDSLEASSKWLLEHRLPLVAFSVDDRLSCRVSIDYPEMIRLGAQEVLKAGAEKLGVILPFQEGGRHGETIRACHNALENVLSTAGLPLDSATVGLLPATTERDRYTRLEVGYYLTRQLMSERPEIDGFICADDQLSVGAIQYLQEKGRPIPFATHANREANLFPGNQKSLIRLNILLGELVDELFRNLEAQIATGGRHSTRRTILIAPVLETIS